MLNVIIVYTDHVKMFVINYFIKFGNVYVTGNVCNQGFHVISEM